MTDWDVGPLVEAAAVVVAAAAVVVLVCLVAARSPWQTTVSMFLDVLLAAALLHLGATERWSSIAAVAVLVLVRAAWGLRTDPQRSRRQ